MTVTTNDMVVDVDGVTSSWSFLINSTAFDLAAYLESHLGCRYRNLAESVILTLIYCCIFVTGVIGNVSTTIVIVNNTSMHTATNYYLLSLAVSDTLTLCFGLPPELYTIWEAYPWLFGQPYCLFKTFLTEMTSSASILTILAFTVERYMAICHPMKAQTMSNLNRSVKVIVAIWVTACVISVPFPIHTRAFYYLRDPVTSDYVGESLVCSIPLEWMPAMKVIFQLYTFVLFVVPMLAMIGLYVFIGVALRKSQLASHSFRNTRSSTHLYSRRAVVKILVAVVVSFFFCWAPFHAQRILSAQVGEDEWTPALLEVNHGLFYVSGILYYVSSTINPILYNLMSRKFRRAFRQTLCFCFVVRKFSRSPGGRRFVPSPCYSDASVTVETAVEVSVTRSRQKLARPLATRVGECRLVSPSDTLVVPGWQHVAARGGEKDPSARMLGAGLLKTETGRMLAYETDYDDDEDSDSVSSLPSTLAAYIREELELSQYREVLRSSEEEPRLQRQEMMLNGLAAAELEMEEMETEDSSLCLR